MSDNVITLKDVSEAMRLVKKYRSQFCEHVDDGSFFVCHTCGIMRISEVDQKEIIEFFGLGKKENEKSDKLIVTEDFRGSDCSGNSGTNDRTLTFDNSIGIDVSMVKVSISGVPINPYNFYWKFDGCDIIVVFSERKIWDADLIRIKYSNEKKGDKCESKHT